MKQIWNTLNEKIKYHWRLHWLLIGQVLLLMISLISIVLFLEQQLDTIEDYQNISLLQAQDTEKLVDQFLNNGVDLHLAASGFYHEIHAYEHDLYLLSLDPDIDTDHFLESHRLLLMYQAKLNELLPSNLMQSELNLIKDNLLILQVITDEVIDYKKTGSIAEISYLYQETHEPMRKISTHLATVQRKIVHYSQAIYRETQDAVQKNLYSIEKGSEMINQIQRTTVVISIVIALVIIGLQLLFNALFHYRIELLANFSNKVADNIHADIPILAHDNTGQLAKNLYDMSERIYKNRLEIENLNKTLEQKIEQRTATLQQTNEELQATNEELLSTNEELYSALDSIVLAERQLQEEINEHKRTQVLLKAAMIEADEARLHAEKSSSAKSEFLANMSHEIRTPMNAILGFTEILSNRINDPNHLHYLSTITSSGRTLLALLNDVLDLSKVEAGKFALEYAAVNPKMILQELHDMFADKIFAKKLEFKVEMAQDLPPLLMLDETRFRQILLNLLSNALKFTATGYIKVIVEAQPLDRKHITLKLQVEDTGMGIAKNQQEVIFEAFEQQDGQSHAKYGGTGLGLTITKRIVEMMDGEISVVSHAHVGSTFTIVLHSVEIADKTSDELEMPALPLNQIEFAPATVLVADDVMLNREVIHAYLDSYPKLTLIDAEDGYAAVKLALAQQPDIILMDIRMPNMNGDEALVRLRRHRDTAKIPVIAITASVFRRSDNEIVLFDGYLLKPVQQQQLVQALMQFLPYTVATTATSAQPESLDAAISSPSDMPGIVPIEQDMTALLAILEQEVIPQWQTFNQADFFDMSGITAFSQQVQTLAEAYQCPLLLEWAQKLHMQAKMFDMGQLPKTLRQFEDILLRLRKTIK